MTQSPFGTGEWPAVTFLIPTLNSAETLTGCLQSIFELDYEMGQIRVWILDGMSTDGTVELAKDFDVRVFRLGGNPAVAYNSVLSNVTTPFVALVDSDAMVDKSWLRIMLTRLADTDSDAAGSRILSASPDTFWAKAIGRELDDRYSRLPSSVERIATTCMVLNTEVLRKIGGFDEDLPTGYDWALGYELSKGGSRIVFVPEAVVFHSHRRSLSGYARQQFAYGRDAVRLTRRWPKALSGDAVTPWWMTVQPVILLAIALLVIVSLAIPQLLIPLAGIALGGVSVLLPIWMGTAIRVVVRTKDVRSFAGLMTIGVVRAEAWTLGIAKGVVWMITAAMRAVREDGD